MLQQFGWLHDHRQHVDPVGLTGAPTGPASFRGHLHQTGVYFAHGFLGVEPMRAYLAHQRAQFAGRPSPFEPSYPPRTCCSAWGGLGSQVILQQGSLGSVDSRLWARFSRAALKTTVFGFYEGFEGAVPALVCASPGRPTQARRLAASLHQRLVARLQQCLGHARRGADVKLGLAHGLCGTLLALEMVSALLGVDERALRRRVLRLLIRSARLEADAQVWPTSTRSTVFAHGVCSGAPGVCLTAILGWRYSADPAYQALIQLAMPSVPVAGALGDFCCGTLGRIEVLLEAYRTFGTPQLLVLAKSLFGRVSPSTLRGESWKEGTAGYEFTELRLGAPTMVDLPGLPMRIEPLRSSVDLPFARETK